MDLSGYIYVPCLDDDNEIFVTFYKFAGNLYFSRILDENYCPAHILPNGDGSIVLHPIGDWFKALKNVHIKFLLIYHPSGVHLIKVCFLIVETNSRF